MKMVDFEVEVDFNYAFYNVWLLMLIVVFEVDVNYAILICLVVDVNG